jgi:excinuclease ABC subunit C
LQSVLDTIPGVGPKRKAALLRNLGSVQNIQAASLAQLRRVPGFNRKVAEAVHRHLGRGRKITQAPPEK